jgi:hypothetical protein
MTDINIDGFIIEKITIEIGDKKYQIPTDPSLESYFKILHILKLINTEDQEKWLPEQKKFIVGLITENNQVSEDEIKELDKLIGVLSTLNFMKQYIEILKSKGVLSSPGKDDSKNLIPPPEEEKN